MAIPRVDGSESEHAKFMQAAVLHDTVEDTCTTFEELEQSFGAEVKGLVAEVSDDKSLPKMERKRLQVSTQSLILIIIIISNL